jgi:hypothetical protein
MRGNSTHKRFPDSKGRAQQSVIAYQNWNGGNVRQRITRQRERRYENRRQRVDGRKAQQSKDDNVQYRS